MHMYILKQHWQVVHNESFGKYINIFSCHEQVSALIMDIPKEVNQLMDIYDSTLRGLINKHAPWATELYFPH